MTGDQANDRRINVLGRSGPIFFLHIPRTAGTTFKQILERQYGTHRIYDTQVFLPGEAGELERNATTLGKRFDVISGHMAYGVNELFGARGTYITFLRDPIARVASFFRYVSRRRTSPLYDIINERRLSLRAFIAEGVAPDHTDNGQTRMLGGDRVVSRERCDEGTLELAKSRLQTGVEAFGLSERFDESLLLFARTLGWIKPVFYLRRNETGGGDIRTLAAADVELLQRHNELDLELYRFASDLFDDRLRRQRFFRVATTRFKATNRALAPILKRRERQSNP